MLRTISILCAMSLMLAASAAWAGVPGDCDGNGQVDGSDAALARDAVGTSAGDDGYIDAADMDGDGTISLADLNAILQASQ
jgi:hypothetical protein